MTEFTDEIKKIKVTFTDGTSEDFESFKDLEEYLKEDDTDEEDTETESDSEDKDPMTEENFNSYKARRLAERQKKSSVQNLSGE